MNPLISVIIPIYNVEKYLSKCLDSVINQDYENLEIILVNDGTRDNSLAIANTYQSKDTRIKVYSQRNQGLSAARNIGLDKANGDYITFIDSDDYIDLDFYCGLSYHLLLYSNCLNHCQNKFRLHLGVYLNMKFFRIQLHLFMKSFLPQVYLLLYYFQQVSLKPNFLN